MRTANLYNCGALDDLPCALTFCASQIEGPRMPPRGVAGVPRCCRNLASFLKTTIFLYVMFLETLFSHINIKLSILGSRMKNSYQLLKNQKKSL